MLPSHAALGQAFCLVLLGAGCAKKVTVNGASVKSSKEALNTPEEQPAATSAPEPAPGPTPVGRPEAVEIPDAFGVDRVLFQSRSPVTLRIVPAKLEAGATFAITNDTTGRVLVEPRPVAFGLALSQEGNFGLLATPSDVFVRFYLLDPGIRDKFVYGENTLLLQVAGDAPQVARQRVRLRDFPVFGPAPLRFGSGRQRAGDLQGEVALYRQQAMSAGGSVLTTGFTTMVNQ